MMATESTEVTDTIPSSEATAPRQRPTEDVGVVSEELWAELNELAFTMTDDEAERIYRRRDVTSVLEPKCDRCMVYQGMCTDALKSVHRLSAMVTELEELRPQCEVLKKQVAESQIQIEESLQAEHVLKTRAETAEAEAAQAKEKFDALEKDFDVMAKAAEEGKKHAHEANAWRVKYERTSELSIKIQQKRKADMENFDKVFNLASGYYKEVKHLTASRSAIRKEFNKLSKLVKTYVPVMFSVIKSAMSLPMFKTELPNNIQQDAEKLCTGDVERAFELDYPDHCSDTDEDDDDGMSSELERLVGCVKLTKKPVESKLPWKPSLTVTVPRKGEKVPVQPVEEQSSNVADIPAIATVPEPEPLPSVMEPGPSELVEPSIEQLGDEEADALLEVGAEAITMPVPRLSTRGGPRGRGRRGRGARQTPASAAQPQALEVFAVNKSYEEILASKLKRKVDVPETTASTSTMKHMSIHGKKTMSVREQQEAQMKISVKEKVALMKKKEEAERVRTLDDDIEGDDACSPAAEEAADNVAPASKAVESESPKKSTVEDFSIARNDLLLSASPSPASSVIEGEEGAAEREELSAQVPSLDEEKCEETVVQAGDDEIGMDTVGPAAAEKGDSFDARESSATQKRKPTLVDVAKDLIIDCDIPISFIDQILDSEGTEKPPEATSSPYEESKSRVTTQIEIDMDLDLAESSETAHTEEFLEGEERGPELNVVLNSAESSVPIVAQPPTEGGDTARNEEFTLTVQESEAVTVKMGPNVIGEKEVDGAAQKDMDRSESTVEPVANKMASISSAAETEPRGVECGKEESVMSKPALAGDTKRAIGFARRLLVDLEEMLTPIHGGEDGEQMMSIPSSGKVVAEQLDESKTRPEGASSSPEKNRSHVDEEADASSCTVEKVIDATPVTTPEVSENLSNKSPSKRQPPVRRLSAKDRDLAMQLHAQLNPRSLRSRRESESDSQNPRSASVEHDTTMKHGRRKMRTLSDSQKNDAEMAGSLEMVLKKNLSESKDMGGTSAPLGFAIVAESKTSIERDTEARSEQTPKKIRADDVSHDVLAIACDNSTQEGDVVKKLPTPAKVSETTTDLFDEILAGARSNTTSQRKVAKRKKVPAPKKVHTSGDHASKSKLADGEISVGPSVSQENKASADTSCVVERESTEEAPSCSEPAPNIEVHSRLLSPSSSRESVKDKGASDSMSVAGRTRHGSTGKRSTTNVEFDSRQQPQVQKQQSEQVTPSKQTEEMAGTPRKRKLDLKKSTTTEEAPTESLTGGLESFEHMSSPRRTRASGLRTSAVKFSPEPTPPARVSTRTEPLAPRKRRLEGHPSVGSLSESQKPEERKRRLEEEKVSKTTTNIARKGPQDDVSSPKATKTESMKTPLQATKLRRHADGNATEALSSEGPPSRVTRRTGPVAPRKRRFNEDDTGISKPESNVADVVGAASVCSQDSISASGQGIATRIEEQHNEPTTSSQESDDEDRLCVAEDEATENAEHSPSSAPICGDDEMHLVIDDGEEERLVVQDREEQRLDVDDEKTAEKEKNVHDKAETSERVSEDSVNKGLVGQEKTQTSTSNEDAAGSADEQAVLKPLKVTGRGTTDKAKKSKVLPEAGMRPGASKSTSRSMGALGAAKRSVPDFKAGPAAMEKFNATLSRQLKRGQPKAPIAASSRTAKPPPSSESPIKVSSTTRCAPPRPVIAAPARGLKRKREESLKKLLEGALLSEQKIEVIRNNLAEHLEEISNMSPQVFAVAMTQCSLNLHSGDMWTIVQKNCRDCDSSHIRNTKEDTFLQNCRELGGKAEIWLHYVEKMKFVFATQNPNPIYSGRYIRLFMQALRETGDLISWDEKKDCLRTVLTILYLQDIRIAIKATTFALLTPYYNLLDWMKDRDCPFSVLLSLAVTTAHMEGKVLLWAWFQQFAEELPLQDVSTENVKKAFDNLITSLDECAEKRAHQMGNDTPIPTTFEENALCKWAIAYLSPCNGSHVNLRFTLNCLMNTCISCIKMAMNPRALGGNKAWSDVYKVSNRSNLFIGITMCALSYRDDLSVSRDVCDLLNNEIPLIREVRDELAALTATDRPWVNVYRDIVGNLITFLQMTLKESHEAGSVHVGVHDEELWHHFEEVFEEHWRALVTFFAPLSLLTSRNIHFQTDY
ncbi:unnamed protein product [Haemonchus placei]|uniref:BAR domain-containing protein n=1 Tax=Haemonchus placei TaxID=6290 RepID=A0A0N4W8I9_HAEPC|nr:unnamed protein product [Haemonchus placei]